MTDAVRVEIGDDGVAVLTLDRPERRNPLSDPDLLDGIVGGLERVARDRRVRALVVTGAGPAFSAGGNVHEMRDRTGMFAGNPHEVSESYVGGVQRIPLAFAALDIPTIAAVNGPAFGAGCDMTFMCDLRIASTAASFGEVFVNLGLISGDGGTWFLVRHLGYQRAAEITLTGRVVDAAEAKVLGLVLDVVPPEELLPAALTLARRIAAQPAPALRMAKRLLKAAERTDLPTFLATAAAFQALAHHTPEHADALAKAEAKRTRRE